MAYIFSLIIWGLIWGFATRAVIKSKGYDDNWFWWGFFFGLIAFIVAIVKEPYPRNTTGYGNSYGSSYGGSQSSSVFHDETGMKAKSNDAQLLAENGWRCNNCKKINASYVGTCSCGNTKFGNDTLVQRRVEEAKRREEEYNLQQEAARKAEEEKRNSDKEMENLQKIKQYKDLLDSGIISQEEFDKKKEELLDL